MIRKMILGLVALASVAGFSLAPAPANAAVGPDWNERISSSYCGLISCTRVHMKVWFSERHNGAVTVNQVRIWADNPDNLRVNDAMTINKAQVLGPAGVAQWTRTGVEVDKSVGNVSQTFSPDFDVDVYGSMYLKATLHWSDGSSDVVTMSGGSIG